MTTIINYAKYLLKHRIYVMFECFKRRLIWQGLIHDFSKLLPSEFFPYANHFYKKGQKPVRDKTGYYKPSSTGDKKFDRAWLSHTRKNKHHWQFWALACDYGEQVLFPMPDKYILEMFCDWIGASRAQGHESGSVNDWYKNNSYKMQLHPETRVKIKKILHEWKNKVSSKNI